MDGRSILPLQQYYVIGRLQSVSSYNSCVNSTDPKIASNANPFLNCTLDGLPLNDPVVYKISWLPSETIQVWWIFSEPVVVNSVRWTFDLNAGSIVEQIRVRQSTDGSHFKEFNVSHPVTTEGQRAHADLMVHVGSQAVDAAEYWIFEFSTSHASKAVLIEGRPSNISKY